MMELFRMRIIWYEEFTFTTLFFLELSNTNTLSSFQLGLYALFCHAAVAAKRTLRACVASGVEAQHTLDLTTLTEGQCSTETYVDKLEWETPGHR